MATGDMLAESVLTLLKEHGQALTLRRVAEGSYDPATGTTGSATTTNQTVNVAFVEYKKDLIDGQNVVQGDRKALVAARTAANGVLSITPKVQDQIVGEDETVNIVDVRTIKSGANVAAYICQVRGP